ncbi:MAG: hypothetical protein ACT4PE_11695 [Candidatus Eiseniibacteriota bacterium]
MFRTRTTATALLLGAASLLQGCLGSDGSLGADDVIPATDEEAIEVVMESDEANSEMSTTDVLVMNEEASDGGAALAPINTCRWFREPSDIDRRIQIVINEPSGEAATAQVTASVFIAGTLHLFACEPDLQSPVDKRFDDSGSLHMLFQRVRPIREDRRHRGWQLAAVSGIELASEGTTRDILSVRVVSGDVDRTFTDMAELVRVADLLRLPANTEVLVFAKTDDPTDAVYLHLHRAHRTAMVDSDGDGTFEGRFTTSERPGPHRFAVDVLSDGTLFDDAAPYDNVAWGMLYLIEGANDGPRE